MKWITHQAGALAAALWFQADPAVCVGMAGGAVLPDMLERMVSRGNRRRFLRIHREWLHWFGWYAGLLAAALVPSPAPSVRLLAAGAALGALSHLLLDALNPSGVPLLPFRSRPRLRYGLVSTGSWGEWCLAGMLCVLIALARVRA